MGLLELEAPPGLERQLEALAERAVPMLPELERELGGRFRRRFRMVLIPPGPRSPEIAALDSLAPEWAAGFVMPERRLGGIRVARAAQYPYGTVENVLAHEAAHVLLRDLDAGELPLWFEEGVASWLARRWGLEDAFHYTTALLTTDVPRLDDLDSAFRGGEAEARLGYAASFAFVARSVRRTDPGFLRRLLAETRERPFPAAWEAAAGVPLERMESEWRRESLIRYRWIPILTASSTLWIGISLLVVLAAARKRRRLLRQRERWDAEERLDDNGTGGPEATESPPPARP